MTTRTRNKLVGTLRARVSLYMVITTAVSLAICCGFIYYSSVKGHERLLVRQHRQLANMLADSSAAPILFQQPQAASRALNVLETHEQVRSVAVYALSSSGELERFASFTREEGDSLPIPIEPFSQVKYGTGTMQLSREIWLEGELLGYVTISVMTTGMWQEVSTILYSTIGAFCVSILLAMLLSLKFQRRILKPIENLRQVAESIVKRGDFSQRATVAVDDEVGELAALINLILDQVQEHDRRRVKMESKLRDLNDNLGNLVASRTRELERSNHELSNTLRVLSESERMRVADDFFGEDESTAQSLGVPSTSGWQPEIGGLASDYITSGEENPDQDLDAFLTTGLEVTELIQKNLDRAAGLMSEASSFSALGEHEAKERVLVTKVLAELMVSLSSRLQSSRVQISTRNCQPIELYCNYTALSLVLSNMLLHVLSRLEEGGATFLPSVVFNVVHNEGVVKLLCTYQGDPGHTLSPEPSSSLRIVGGLVNEVFKGEVEQLNEEGYVTLCVSIPDLFVYEEDGAMLAE